MSDIGLHVWRLPHHPLCTLLRLPITFERHFHEPRSRYFKLSSTLVQCTLQDNYLARVALCQLGKSTSRNKIPPHCILLCSATSTQLDIPHPGYLHSFPNKSLQSGEHQEEECNHYKINLKVYRVWFIEIASMIHSLLAIHFVISNSKGNIATIFTCGGGKVRSTLSGFEGGIGRRLEKEGHWQCVRIC